MFEIGEFVILNEKAAKGLPSRVGTRCKVIEKIKTTSYDYIVNFDDFEKSFVKETELNKLTHEDKSLMKYIFVGNVVMYIPSTQKVKIIKVDYIHNQAEIKFDNGETAVVSVASLSGLSDEESDSVKNRKIGYFELLGTRVGKLVDEKQKAYGDSVTKCYEIMKVLLKDYKNDDNTYTIPETLLPQMLLDVRKIDKMNRRFSNPDGDLMGENPFQDDVGYSLLGVRMIEQLNDK